LKEKTKASKKNIFIVPINEGNIEMIRQWRNKDEIRNNFVDSEIITEEQQKEWHKTYLQDETDKMFLISLEDKPIGCISLYNIGTKDAEFGKLIIGDERYQGKGYAKEATYRLCKYGFNSLALDNIQLSVFEDNDSALNIYGKIGFKSKGKSKVKKRNLVKMNLNKSDLKKGNVE
jgi:diamine N-acetyltransferase